VARTPVTLEVATLQSQDLRPYPPLLRVERREGVAWLAPLFRGAPGVEEHEAVLILQKGDVGVAEDDDAGVREAAAQARPAALLASGVVDHGDPRAAELELEGLREIQVRGIEVAADGMDGGVGAQLVEEVLDHEVPGVEYEIGALEVRQQVFGEGSRSAGHVGIRDNYGQGAHWGRGEELEPGEREGARALAPIL
jgi:hypothetical protein